MSSAALRRVASSKVALSSSLLSPFPFASSARPVAPQCSLSLLSPLSSIRHATTSSSSTSPSSPTSYSLPPLPYDYSALEPAISGQIMETHHKKHHQTYVTNLNAALSQLQEAQHKGDLSKQIQLQSAVNFNGGGHLNHSIFWTNLAPKSQGGGSPPTGDLAKAIEEEFGGVSAVQQLLTTACLGIQGSGWGWLTYHPTQQRLQIITKPNQDPVVDAIPLLGIDVWEHAYYYLYGPARAEYLKQIWTVVNWKDAEQRLAKAKTAAPKK